MLLLPNYHVTYYDYIVKWCSGIACNWCVSVDVGLILALKIPSNDLVEQIDTVSFQHSVKSAVTKSHHFI